METILDFFSYCSLMHNNSKVKSHLPRKVTTNK